MYTGFGQHSWPRPGRVDTLHKLVEYNQLSLPSSVSRHRVLTTMHYTSHGDSIYLYHRNLLFVLPVIIFMLFMLSFLTNSKTHSCKKNQQFSFSFLVAKVSLQLHSANSSVTNLTELHKSMHTYILDGDKAVETFALDGMWMSDDGSLRNQRMLNEYRLDISCTQQVTRHVQHVIDAPGDPQVTISITLCTWHNTPSTIETQAHSARSAEERPCKKRTAKGSSPVVPLFSQKSLNPSLCVNVRQQNNIYHENLSFFITIIIIIFSFSRYSVPEGA